MWFDLTLNITPFIHKATTKCSVDDVTLYRAAIAVWWVPEAAFADATVADFDGRERLPWRCRLMNG